MTALKSTGTATPRPAPASALTSPAATYPAPAQHRRHRPSLGVSGPIPITTVPRAAIEALVAHLVADGAVTAPTPSVSSN